MLCPNTDVIGIGPKPEARSGPRQENREQDTVSFRELEAQGREGAAILETTTILSVCCCMYPTF
jgi:hypothetical protein